MNKILPCIFFLLFSIAAFAQECEITFFYSPTCSHCETEKVFLAKMQENYPQLSIVRYDVTKDHETFVDYSEEKGTIAVWGCTMILPMQYVLIQNYGMTLTLTYVFFTALYCLVYIIPLFVILGSFLHAFRPERITEYQARVLKLASGIAMILIGSNPNYFCFNANE